ncbi:MAG: hypothetical protein J0H65_17580 [Rhizobiales bacterium]|nr:hypothetical protein [Hyphomicrobiales bacterium]
MPTRNTRSPRQTIDIGRRLAADRHLQVEIDKGLASLADEPPSAAGQRIARVLSAVLEPSWSEHADFQDEALFPIIAKARTTTLDTRALINRLGREHAEIGRHQREVTVILNNLVAGRLTSRNGIVPTFSRVLDLRRRHHAAEAALETMLPAMLEQTDRTALDHWAASRAAPPFPVNLILDFWE